MENVLEYYRSLDTRHRFEEEQIIRKALENGVSPLSVRYGVFKDVYRGVMKSLDGDLTYFHYRPDNDSIRLMPPQTDTQQWDAERMFKACDLGVDLKQEGDEEDDEDELDKGPAGGEGGFSGPSSRTEQQALNQQDDMLTEQHPGGIGAMTPDRPEVGRQWHEEAPVETVGKSAWTAQKLLDGLNDSVRKSVPRGWRVVDPTERQFMTQELGRTDAEIDYGQAVMSPIQKVQYQRWLNKGLNSNLSNLSDWLNKQRG